MKKPLAFVLAAVLSCGLCGCAKDPSKLTVKLNGVKVERPLTVEKLGGDYRLNSGFLLYYKDELVAGLTFDEMPGSSNEPIKYIVVDSLGNENLNFMTVNGISLSSSSADVLRTFGEPADKNDETGWMYREDKKSEDDYYLSINFDKNEKVSQIRVKLL